MLNMDIYTCDIPHIRLVSKYSEGVPCYHSREKYVMVVVLSTVVGDSSETRNPQKRLVVSSCLKNVELSFRKIVL